MDRNSGAPARASLRRLPSRRRALGPAVGRLRGGPLASEAIRQSVLTRHMPRWYASSGSGEFANDRTLTPNEIELLARWADDGAPYGDPPLVTRPHAPGKPLAPDLLLTVPFKHRIEAAAHTFSLATGLGETRWIRGWTFRPGNPALIASAVIALGPGKPLGTWVPGEAATFLPHGIAQRLPAGTDVTLTIHYRKPEAAAVDASSVGLYFAADSSQELAHLSLPCGPTRLRRSDPGTRHQAAHRFQRLVPRGGGAPSRRANGSGGVVPELPRRPRADLLVSRAGDAAARNVHRSGRDRRHMRRRARIRGCPASAGPWQWHQTHRCPGPSRPATLHRNLSGARCTRTFARQCPASARSAGWRSFR